ncbi:MAG: LUD domain-containing protein [Nitrososphaerota archaeon]|nr:LUD domain-containing protein [Nitrososphaerota archaeon]
MSASDSFAQAVRSLNAEAVYAATEEETRVLVREVVSKTKASTVAIAGVPSHVSEVVHSALTGVNVVEPERLGSKDVKQALATTELGITWAMNGVVKEGALLEVAWDDAVKLTSCLPMSHLALVAEKSLLPDFTAGMREAGKIVVASPLPKPTISFIAGPSRTADIEGRLLYGVHGPHSLTVAILGWA